MRTAEGRCTSRRRQFALCAIGVMCLLTALPTSSSASSRSKRSKKSATQIKRDLHSVRSRIQQKRQQIRANRQRDHKVTAEIVAVEHRLLTTESRLRRSRSRLETLAEQQTVLKQRIEATERRLQSRRRVLSARLRSNYEQGNTGYMTVLLGSRSLHDYMSRSYYVGRIVDNDVKLLEGIKADKEQLATDKQELDEKAAETKQLTASLADDQEEQSGDYKEKAGLLKELRQDRRAMVEALDEMERASNSMEAELRAMQRTPRGRARMLHAWSGSFIRPADGPLTSGFGSRYHPILHRTRMHTGIDIGAGYGAPIHAAGGGEVIFSGYRNGYGNCVVIDHGGGVATLYGHCSSLNVSVGQVVRQGQLIARVGSTGLATGPHLHFEVRHNGTPVNPQ